jgi:hypothetical protein
MRFQNPTSGPRSISPESPGGSGNCASASSSVDPPDLLHLDPRAGESRWAGPRVPNPGATGGTRDPAPHGEPAVAHWQFRGAGALGPAARRLSSNA